jgi:hypothetical protein
MEKNFFYTVVTILILIFLSCSKENTVENATLAFSADQVELENTENSVVTVEINSNQTAFRATIDEVAKSWCSISIIGKVITIKAIADNPDPTTRTATITIIAGEGSNIATKYLLVTQLAGDTSATLSLTEESVTLSSAASSTAIVEITSNQSNFQATINDPAIDWCSVSIMENVILITTLSENNTGEARTAVITIAAGTGSNIATKKLTVTQLSPMPSIIGQVIQGGVVFWQDTEDPKKCKIVSATRLEGESWCPQAIETIATGANSEDDGLANTSTIKALSNFDQYAAVKYCTDMGEGWYLPSKNEVLALFEAYNGTKISDATLANPNEITPAEKTARTTFDAALTSIPNGVPLNTAADNAAGNSIWSSSESPTTPTNVWWVRFGKFAVDTGVKRSTARTVRAVKFITID